MAVMSPFAFLYLIFDSFFNTITNIIPIYFYTYFSFCLIQRLIRKSACLLAK